MYGQDGRIGLFKVTSLGAFKYYMAKLDCSIMMIMISIVRFTVLLWGICLSHHIFHQWVNKWDLDHFVGLLRHWYLLNLHLQLRLGSILSVVLNIADWGWSQVWFIESSPFCDNCIEHANIHGLWRHLMCLPLSYGVAQIMIGWSDYNIHDSLLTKSHNDPITLLHLLTSKKGNVLVTAKKKEKKQWGKYKSRRKKM